MESEILIIDNDKVVLMCDSLTNPYRRQIIGFLLDCEQRSSLEIAEAVCLRHEKCESELSALMHAGLVKSCGEHHSKYKITKGGTLLTWVLAIITTSPLFSSSQELSY